MILSQRKEIGTLLAIGYGPGKIFFTYVLGGIVIGIMGSVFSIPLAILVRNLFAIEYANAIGLPDVIYVTSGALVIEGLAMALGIAILAAAWPAFRVVRMSPQEAIRAPQSAVWSVGRRFQQALIRHLPSSAHLGFGLRNLLRRKGLAFSTIVCIALAVGVAISYVVSMSSVNFTVEQYFEQDQWSLAVDLLSPVSIEQTSTVSDMENRRLDCRLVGRPHDSPLNNLNLVEGRSYRGEGSLEIVLDKEDARDLGAEIGDSIRVVAGMQEVETVLVGLVTGLMSGQVFGGLEMSRTLLEMEEQVNGLFLSLKPGVEEEKIIDQLYSLDYVGKVTSKEGVVHDFLALTSEIMGIVYLCAAISILTGILFIFTGITLNILEREGEYATLQTLGFGRSHLVGIVLSEVMVQAIVALILSIPAAAVISVFLTGRMSDAWFNVANNFTADVVLWTVIPALLVMPLATVPGLRSIFRIDIAEAARKAVMD
jgi:putative ABC transport system permease protein